jgi:hypothetical protein
MSDHRVLLQAMDLRARAEEIRTRAETFHGADLRKEMREIAARYIRLAERLERHARDADDAG